MTSKLQKISDDWGWFIDIDIDIEHNNTLVKDYYVFQRPYINFKKPLTYLKILPVIKEDESVENVNTHNNKIVINKKHYYNEIYITSIFTLSIISYILYLFIEL